MTDRGSLCTKQKEWGEKKNAKKFSSVLLSSPSLSTARCRKAKKTRKFATVKRMISQKDPRMKKTDEGKKGKGKEKGEEKTVNGEIVRHVQQANSALYFQYNTQLGPPYQVLVDTNFINFSIQNKLELNKVRSNVLSPSPLSSLPPPLPLPPSIWYSPFLSSSSLSLSICPPSSRFPW